MMPVDEFVEVADGVRLRVRCWSGRLGPPFLLVHGLSSNALLWDEVAVRLSAAGYPAYAVDLRSHGESDSPPDGYDTTTAADDVAAVHAHFGLGSAIAVGQSWGGDVVVRLAARNPTAVAALALVDGGWTDLSANFDSWAACERALRPPEVGEMRPDQLRQLMRKGHPGWSAQAIEATMANLRTTVDDRLERRLPIDRHMRIVRSMWDEPPLHDYPAISVSALLLPAIPAGTGSDVDRRRAAVAKAVGALAAAQVKEYVGADHDIHAQHPAELARDLLDVAAAV
jgi:pimeloyl-ACP methyl ester carboxylesterase